MVKINIMKIVRVPVYGYDSTAFKQTFKREE